MPDSVPESAIVGTIRCRCGSRMSPLEDRTKATSDGILYTVECSECKELGGYNSRTLETFGALGELELIGE